eukprot:COSAG02_NODE_5802_length_4026_cov_4.072320_7_plen_60_part_00
MSICVRPDEARRSAQVESGSTVTLSDAVDPYVHYYSTILDLVRHNLLLILGWFVLRPSV